MGIRTKLGIALVGLTGLAGALQAAEYKLNAEGTEGSTFYTVFTNIEKGVNYSNYGSVNVTDSKNRGFTLNWDNKNDNRADFAAGAGFGNKDRPKNIYYSVTGWNIERGGNNGMFGVYGWSCPTDQKISGHNNVEFYIVEAWVNSSVKQFVPYDTTYRKSVTANGATYKIYTSPTYTRANACKNKADNSAYPFHQVWAVRQGQRYVNSKGVGLAFSTISNVMDDYGYFTYNLRYLVVGVDAFADTKGKISIGYVSSD